MINSPEVSIKKNLDNRKRGLEPLLDNVLNKTVLDLGAAEGLISHWLLVNGKAKHVTCVERKPQSIETSHQLFEGKNYQMIDDDLGKFEQIKLAPKYDVVMALGIVQKLMRKQEFIKYFAEKANEFFVIRIPTSYLSIKQVQQLLPEFELFHHLLDESLKGERSNGWVGIFKRT